MAEVGKEEIWMPVIGWENDFQVSNLGRVKSKHGCILKPYILRRYVRHRLSANGRRGSISGHRIVLEAFVGKSDLPIDHINGDPADNRLENLEYVSQRENVRRYLAQLDRTLPIGVYLTRNKRNPYGAQITFRRRVTHLGVYDCPIKASEAYQAAFNLLEKSTDGGRDAG